MEIIELKYSEEFPIKLLSLLKGNVFHITHIDSYDEIIKNGQINNNKDNIYRLNSSSKRSYGRNNGKVCLFDLREHNKKYVEETLYKTYNFLSPPWFRKCYPDYFINKQAYLILNPDFHHKLIPYNSSILEEEYNQAIPQTEAWIDDHIPILWISRVYLVNIKCDAPAKGTLPRALYDIELRNQTKNRRTNKDRL